MTDDNDRIDALDFLRGLAVMGMALTSVAAMGLPSVARFTPFTSGTGDPWDLAAWAFNFVLVDGPFRALIAMVLGASMLLFMEKTELEGGDGLAAYRRRMIWLLFLGLGTHVLLWSGDILLPLAVSGLVATTLAGRDTFALVKWALALLALQWAIDLVALIMPLALQSILYRPDAAAESALAHSSYIAMLSARAAALPRDLSGVLLFVLPEMLAFMTLGMAMLKGGFLAAQWTPDQYRATWRRGYLVGLAPMAALATWVLISGEHSSAGWTASAWSVPLHLPIAAAHAALALTIAIRFPGGVLAGAVRALGRLALSNYLLFTLLGTTLFYGYGAGLFARLDRAVLLAIAVGSWAAMLLWSSLWRRRVGQGPAERLWRRLARSKSA